MRIFYYFFYYSSRVFNKLYLLTKKFAKSLESEDLSTDLVRKSTRYDMVHAPDEPYYADQYWKIMEPYFTKMPVSSHCLDLGCSQGRFAIRLGRHFNKGHVTGCDLSDEAIAQANENLRETGLTNVNLTAISIEKFLLQNEDQRYDLILMTEVTVFFADWVNYIETLKKMLNKDGLLIISFRSLQYTALTLVKNRSFDNHDMLLNSRRGKIYESAIEFSWQTSKEIKEIFSEKNDWELLDLVGIGACSGTHFDYNASIIRPSSLNEAEKSKLMELELILGSKYPDSGRYMLAIIKQGSAYQKR